MASLQLHYVVEQEALKLPLLVKVICDLKLLQTLRSVWASSVYIIVRK